VLVNPIRDLRLFDNWFMEMVTKTHWWVIPSIYIPIFLYWYSFVTCSLSEMLAIVFAGVLSWSFAEYMIHRLMFHCEDFFYFPRFSKFYAIHFLVHGIHHAFPQDRLRLVFPPILGLPIMKAVIISPIRSVLPPYYSYPFLIGITIGYILYDMVHYFVHHSDPKDGYMKMIKAYHLQHHYKNGTLGFGVSSKFWDKVFNTEIIDEKKNVSPSRKQE
jgi:4-hydroxysphinganine ceramide fatty acyl 2-hydroxylase